MFIYLPISAREILGGHPGTDLHGTLHGVRVNSLSLLHQGELLLQSLDLGGFLSDLDLQALRDIHNNHASVKYKNYKENSL